MTRSKWAILAGSLLILLALLAWPGAGQAYVDGQSSVAGLGAAPGATSSGEDGWSASGYVPGPLDLSYTQGMQIDTGPIGTADAGDASYDLRDYGRVTSVKDQEKDGTDYSACWAFASLGSLESCLLTGQTWDFSEDNMVLASGFDDNDGAAHGVYFPGDFSMSTAYLVRWGGPITEADDPYGDSLTPSGRTVQKHVQEVKWIPTRASSSDNANIKNAVADYGAVWTALYATDSTSYWNDATDSYYYYGAGNSNHAVLIIGWDDNYPAANFPAAPAGNGAFIVKDSYGTGADSWTEGYLYVSYYDASLGRDSEMAVFNNAESTANYIDAYEWDPLGCILGLQGGIGFSGPTAWFANVFTARADAALSAVGFYTLAPNSTYEIYTGSSITGGALNGKTLRTSGTIPYMGYHTVPLPSSVNITNGQQFVIAVKVTSPGSTSPIGCETPVAGWSSGASASAGQSYVSSGGVAWTDLTTFSGYENDNVCLKGYVSPISATAPTISGLDPTNGPTGGGTSVTINGTNFTGVTGVTFGGTAAVYTVGSPTQITATSPAHAAGMVQVQVTTSEGSTSDTQADDYTYGDVPIITLLTVNGPSASGDISPAGDVDWYQFAASTAGTYTVATTGGTLTDNYMYLYGPDSQSTLVTEDDDSGTGLMAQIARALSPGTYYVKVRAYSVSSGTGTYTINVTSPTTTAPTITNVNPTSGPTGGGTSVTITGTDFTGVTGVTFGGATAGYTVGSPTQITATSPAHAAGLVQVQVNTSGGSTANTLADDYTYVAAPAVTYTSIRGSHRYHTAQLISQAMFPSGLPADCGLVVAPGETFQEALCGAPLAAMLGGPVLLTPASGLENGTKAEIQRLEPILIVCIGLSQTVYNQVEAAVDEDVVVIPINGDNGSVYDMSYQVATFMGEALDMSGATAIVTVGTNFPDAIGVSPVACANWWPILLTNYGDNRALNSRAAAALSELGISKALKVGTYATLPAGIDGVGNLSGADRYYTNANVATWAEANAGLTFAHTALATGDKFPDALASGPYLALDNGTLLLSPLLGPVPTANIAPLLSANAAEIEHLTFIACIEPVISQVKALLP